MAQGVPDPIVPPSSATQFPPPQPAVAIAASPPASPVATKFSHDSVAFALQYGGPWPKQKSSPSFKKDFYANVRTMKAMHEKLHIDRFVSHVYTTERIYQVRSKKNAKEKGKRRKGEGEKGRRNWGGPQGSR